MDQNMPDKLPKKHLFVAVQAVNNEVHKATDLQQRQTYENFKSFKALSHVMKPQSAPLYLRLILVFLSWWGSWCIRCRSSGLISLAQEKGVFQVYLSWRFDGITATSS